jgi:hypothetical protein
MLRVSADEKDDKKDDKKDGKKRHEKELRERNDSVDCPQRAVVGCVSRTTEGRNGGE